MTPRGFTLIEMLIVTAIVAIIAASFAFSAEQIMGRTVAAERTMRVELGLAQAVDALSADVAQAVTVPEATANSLTITLSPNASGEAREAVYALGGGTLTRTLLTGGAGAPLTLIAEAASGEWAAEPGGLRVALRSGHRAMRRVIDRQADVFFAWPPAMRRSEP